MRYQAINLLWFLGAEGQYKSFISFALITYLANFGTSQSLAITDFVRADLNSDWKPHPHHSLRLLSNLERNRSYFHMFRKEITQQNRLPTALIQIHVLFLFFVMYMKILRNKLLLKLAYIENIYH